MKKILKVLLSLGVILTMAKVMVRLTDAGVIQPISAITYWIWFFYTFFVIVCTVYIWVVLRPKPKQKVNGSSHQKVSNKIFQQPNTKVQSFLKSNTLNHQ